MPLYNPHQPSTLPIRSHPTGIGITPSRTCAVGPSQLALCLIVSCLSEQVSRYVTIKFIVELRTPAMPLGLGAFVAVKLRSLCWQHRFEPGWYSREAEGPEQQR